MWATHKVIAQTLLTQQTLNNAPDATYAFTHWRTRAQKPPRPQPYELPYLRIYMSKDF